jgi:NAD(P)H dehydrogenase (quinone)
MQLKLLGSRLIQIGSYMSRYLVTGATGRFGSQVVEFLSQCVPANKIVAFARDPIKLQALAEKGVDIRQGDYLDPRSLEEAFTGVERLLLVSALAFTDAVTQHANVIEAAKRSGVRHVIYTAIQRTKDSDFEIPQVTEWDRKTEALLKASGLAWTILRNPMYLDMLPLGFGKSVTDVGIRVPAGKGLAALASRRDLAEGTAAVLSGKGHKGRIYTFGSSGSDSMSDIAADISEASGRKIDYRDTPVAEFVSARVKEGFPEAAATFFAAWFQAIGAGVFAEVTQDLEHLIGRKPQSAKEFLSAVYALSGTGVRR